MIYCRYAMVTWGFLIFIGAFPLQNIEHFVKNSQISLLVEVFSPTSVPISADVWVCVRVCLFACSKVSPSVLDKGIDVSSGPEDTVNRITVVWRELRRCDRGQYQIPWPILCPVVHTKDNKHRGNRGYCSLFIITTIHKKQDLEPGSDFKDLL